jgi:hypothetical protein
MPGEGSSLAIQTAFESFARFEEEPSSALRAPSPTLRAGEGELDGVNPATLVTPTPSILITILSDSDHLLKEKNHDNTFNRNP